MLGLTGFSSEFLFNHIIGSKIKFHDVQLFNDILRKSAPSEGFDELACTIMQKFTLLKWIPESFFNLFQ